MTKDEALKLALDALEQLQGGCTDHDDGTVEAITVWCPEVIDAIKEALAQPEQEPVAYLFTNVQSNDIESSTDPDHKQGERELWFREALVRPAAQRPWVGLTDKERAEIQRMKWWDWEDTFDLNGFTHSIEAKLKEKNHG